MQDDARLTVGAWQARARGWFLITGVAGVALTPLAWLARLAIGIEGGQTALNGLVLHALLLAGTLCVARGAASGPPRWIALGAAAARAAHLFLALAQVGILPLLSQSGPSMASTAFGYLVTLAAVVAHASLAYAIVRSNERAFFTPLAAGVAAAVGIVACGPRFFGMVEALVQFSLSLLGDLSTAVVYLAFAALGLRFLAPGASAGVDLPDALRETGEGLRSFVTWSRIRAITMALATSMLVFASLSHTGSMVARSLPIVLLLVMVGTGPFLMRALVRMRRAPEGSDVRGPGTAALVLLVLHGLCDAPWIVFLYAAARGHLERDASEALPFLALATMISSCLVDSAVGVAATRLGRALGVMVSGGLVQALVWASYFGSQCLGGAAIAAAGDDEDIIVLVLFVTMALGFGGTTLVQRQMLRATKLTSVS